MFLKRYFIEGLAHASYLMGVDGEAAVVYHLNDTGKGQLYVYDVAEKTTVKVSTRANADYRYPHGEAAPC